MDYMYTVARDRREKPLHMPMSYEQRPALLGGRTVVSSNQATTGNTVPLDSHAEYRSMRAQAAEVPAPPDKGKGKGKSKGKGKAKGKQEWVWRHGHGRPYW